MKITRNMLRRMIAECMSDEMDVHMSDMDAEMEMYGPAEHDGRSMGRGGDAGMARGQLFRTAQKAQSLFDRLSDEDTLPEWVQYKIAMANEYISTAEDYLSYTMARFDMGDPLPAYESKKLYGRYLFEDGENPTVGQQIQGGQATEKIKAKLDKVPGLEDLLSKIDNKDKLAAFVQVAVEYTTNSGKIDQGEIEGALAKALSAAKKGEEGT